MKIYILADILFKHTCRYSHMDTHIYQCMFKVSGKKANPNQNQNFV